MNENASLASSSARSGLGGLPQRLVQDGVVDETGMYSALSAASVKKTSFVTQLIAAGSASARDIAVTAATEYGVPIFDLDCLTVDLDTVRTVSDKLLAKHRVLPLFKRGKRLFLGVTDPTNLHAIDEIKFQTGLAVDAIVVEDDKLQRILDKAIEQVEPMPSHRDERASISTPRCQWRREEGAGVSRRYRRRAHRALRQQALARRHSPRRVGHHFDRTKDVPRLRAGRHPGGMAQPPVQLAKAVGATQGHVTLGHRRARVPQDGRIKMRISKNRAIDFRVSTCPTLFGEKIVARILDPSSAMLGIDALGYEPFQKDLYLQALARPHGMILVTGPTGSGKTVSLTPACDPQKETPISTRKTRQKSTCPVSIR
jgi:type IV pilus assembly protein PilB